MANVKINDLAAASSVTDLMQFEVDTAGTTSEKVTADQLKGYIVGIIPSSSTAPTGSSPPLDPTTGEASIILQPGDPPKLWIGVSSTQWASADLTVFSSGGGGTGAPDYIAALSGTYSSGEIDAINAFANSLQGDTLAAGGTMWDITGFWLQATDNISDRRINIKGASYPLVDSDAGSATFTPRRGIAAGFSNESTTGIVPSAIASNTDSMLFAYSRAAYEFDVPFLAAAGGAAGSIFANPEEVDSDLFVPVSINSDSSISLTAAGQNGQGGMAIIRNGSDILGVVNQTVMTLDSGTLGASGLANGELTFGVQDAPQYAAFAYDHSRAWTTAEAQRFNSYVETLLDVFGAAVAS